MCPGQPAAHGAQVQLVPQSLQVVVDTAGRPLLLTSQRFDPRNDLVTGRGRLKVWDARPVGEAEFTEPAVPAHPFTGARTRDSHLGGHVSDRAALAAFDESAASFDGQWRITVGHGRVFLSADELVVLLILPSKDPSALSDLTPSR